MRLSQTSLWPCRNADKILLMKFPNGFFWGCATSAHQIEGGMNNDWSAWESSASRLATLTAQGKRRELFVSGRASDSAVQDNADIACLTELGANAYRFSIEWSKIQPREEEIDHKELQRYHQFILKLRAHGIEPFVTLWHWPVPLWVRDQGGWENPKTVKDFAAFVACVTEAFGQDVTRYVTLNEPQVYVSNGYVTGEWPPEKKSLLSAFRDLRHLIHAHQAAYAEIKRRYPEAQIGIASHNIHFEARPPLFLNQIAARICSWWWNHYVFRNITQDFVGVNFYFTNQLHLGFGKRQDVPASDIGWDLRPDGLYAVLRELKRYEKPVYILEHGLADKDDRHRAWYLTESLAYVHRAIQEGVDVRGYFHWSLLDNFEWAMGFEPRFGLFEVDYQTYLRRARPSVSVYRKIIQENGLSGDVIE